MIMSKCMCDEVFIPLLDLGRLEMFRASKTSKSLCIMNVCLVLRDSFVVLKVMNFEFLAELHETNAERSAD